MMLEYPKSLGSRHLLVLEPGRVEADYWKDIWTYRELLYVLAWRDISVRYKQTLLGMAWAVIRPLLTVVVFTVVFGKLAKMPSDGDAPYTLLVLCGMLPWTLFASALAEASNSLIVNGNLIGKVYFPRIIVPVATIGVGLIDFLIGLVLLGLFVVYYHYPLSVNILLLPAFVTMALLASLGPGLWLAAQNVNYRDFRYIVPFIIQIGIYVTPIGFSSSVVPEPWRVLYSINPMVGVIDGFRWCILGSASSFYWPGFVVGLIVTFVFLKLGISQFRKTEKGFADII